MGIHRQSLLLLALCLFLPLQQTRSVFLPQPIVKWTYQLPNSGIPGGRGLRKSNAVVQSSNGQTVFATVDDGSLLILRPDLGMNDNLFEPSPIAGTFTECRGGLSIRETASGVVDYVVYSVTDVPVSIGVSYDGIPTTNVLPELQSRVIAVNGDGTLRWSHGLSGNVVGTPLIGLDGDKIYVVHNVPNNNSTANTVSRYRGQMTILSDNNGSVRVAAEVRNENRFGPYAPPSITHTTTAQGQTLDVVMFGESWGDGYIQDGQLYVVTPSSEFDANGGLGSASYTLRTLSTWAESTVTRPLIASNLTAIYVGAGGSVVGGFLGLAANDVLTNTLNPSWVRPVQATERNITQPPLNAPILSADKSLIFLAGSSYDFFCFDAATMLMQWVDFQGRSSYQTEAKLSEPIGLPAVIYVIEYLTGRVRQHDALSGNRNWVFDCVTLTGVASCQDSVEAEFSVSADGNTVVYGDISGKLVGLEVASFTVPPSSVPSVSPSTTASPSLIPSTNPSDAPTGVATPAPSFGPTTLRPSQAPITPAPITSAPITSSPVTSVPVALKPPVAPFGPSLPTITGPGNPTSPTGPTSVSSPTTKAASPVSSSTSSPIASSTPAPTPPVASPFPTVPITRFPSGQVGNPFNPVDNAADNDSNSGEDQARLLLLIAVAAAAILSIVLLALLIFFGLKRRKRRQAFLHRKNQLASKKWEQQQREYEEACERNQSELLPELDGNQVSTPPPIGRHPSKRLAAIPRTPSTLASIEETPEEEESLAGSIKGKQPQDDDIHGLVLKDSTDSTGAETPVDDVGGEDDDDEDSDEDGNKYLPRNLVSSFDSVATDVGSGRNDTHQQVNEGTTESNNDAVPATVATPGVIRSLLSSEDDSSVESSTFMDDNQSIETSSLYIEDESTKGDDKSIATKSSLPPPATSSEAPSPSPEAQERAVSPVYRRSWLGRRERSPSPDAIVRPNDTLKLKYRSLLRGDDNAVSNTANAEPEPNVPQGFSRPDSPGNLSDYDPWDGILSPPRSPSQSLRQAGASPSPAPQPQPSPVSAEAPPSQATGLLNSFLTSLAKAEQEFFNPTLSRTADETGSDNAAAAGQDERPMSPPPPPPPPLPPTAPNKPSLTPPLPSSEPDKPSLTPPM